MRRLSVPKIHMRYVEDTPLWVVLLKDPKGDIVVGIASAETKEDIGRIAVSSSNEKMEVLSVGSLFDYLTIFSKRMQTKVLMNEAFGLTEKEK